MAGVSPGHKKYPGRGGVFVSGGVGVGGLWRARGCLGWWVLWCVYACRCVFKVFSAMFFYMYENMAEFCLLGCNRHAGADDKKARQAQQAWEVVKSAKRQPAPRYSRHTGSKDAAERDQPAAVRQEEQAVDGQP